MERGRVALRVFLVILIALALLVSLWVGYQRSLWESAYKKFAIAVPYQELASIVYDAGDPLLRERLEQLRALGVSALTIELSDFLDWDLRIVQIDRQLLRTLAHAQAVGLAIGFVAEIDDAEIGDRARAFTEALGAEPAWFMLVDLPPMSDSPRSGRERAQGMSKELTWGVLEFAEPAELDALSNKNVVRAHAIKSKELDRLGLSGALERWERAVQERNIRLLWVTGHERFARYLERLGERLRNLGFQSGLPLPFPVFASSLTLYWLIVLGFTALVLLFLQELSLRPVSLLWIVGSGGGLALLGLWDLLWARQILALVISLVAPWALIILLKDRLRGWRFALVVSLGSVGAGLVVAALLSDTAHFLKLQEFRGVKLALVTPMILVIATEIYRSAAYFAPTKRGAWWVATVIGAGVLFTVLERSGNLPLIPVGRWEETIRERLENLFIARPRFKEFLIGHPALLLYGRSSRLVNLSLLALGALGQASIINTFAHLHTPLWLSLWRTLNGLILGLLLGFSLQIVLWMWRQWRRRSS